MRPLWHFVLSFTKHSVQQNPSPLDPQSNLMVLVQWHQKALLSGSLQTALCVVSLSTHTLFFSFQPANHTPWEFSVKLTGMCCLYAKSMIKWKKKGTTFLNELQIQPITGGQAGHQSSCKQASVFSWRKAQLHPEEPSLLGVAHITYAHFLSLDCMYQGGFCLAASEATHILITWPRPASSLKHVNIKRG